MFFRREKPRQVTFSDHLDVLRSAGFTVESTGGATRVSRGRCAAVIEDGGAAPRVDRAGVLVGSEIGYAVHGGYQSFVRTASGKTETLLARDLTALHAFEEDLKEALGLESLYNESLGTTFDRHMYDRVEDRDAGQKKPWEAAR